MEGNMLGHILVCVLIGYLAGSISPSYIIGRIKGFDIREEGSKNAGASNTLIMVGKLAFVFVAFFDIFKAWFSFWICEKLFPELAFAGLIGGVSCVLGHIYPVFLHFHGGKGFACLAGLCLAYNPRTLFLMFLIALLIAFATNYICLVTSLMSVIFPIYYGATTHLWLGALILAIPIIPIFSRHMINFRRIRDGEELRLSYLWKKDSGQRQQGI